MRNPFLVLLILLGLSFSAQSQVKFEKMTLAEALKKAKEEDKKVFVDVYTTWCGPCKRLDRDVFSNAALGQRMSKNYICLKIDNEKHPDRANISKYGISAYPTMLFLEGGSGTLVKKIRGYHDVNRFNAVLDKQLPEEQWPENIARREMQDHPDDQALWKKNLGIIKDKNWRLFDSLAQTYVDHFGLNEINDKLDRDIFNSSEVPLSSPIVQELLKKAPEDEHEFGLYTYMDYKKLAAKAAYPQAKTLEERKAIKKHLMDVYDGCYKIFNGDVESWDQYVEGVFPEVDPPLPTEKVDEEKTARKKRKMKRKKKKQ